MYLVMCILDVVTLVERGNIVLWPNALRLLTKKSLAVNNSPMQILIKKIWSSEGSAKNDIKAGEVCDC